MKKTLPIILIALSLLTVSANTQQKPQQWEYKTEDRCFDEKRINALGAEGWEIAGFSETGRGAWHCVFKRVKN